MMHLIAKLLMGGGWWAEVGELMLYLIAIALVARVGEWWIGG